MRLIFKNLLCRLGLGGWLIEYCQICGVRQPISWWCQSKELWMHVAGSKNAVLCPTCFDKRAEKLGIFLRWHPVYQAFEKPE